MGKYCIYLSKTTIDKIVITMGFKLKREILSLCVKNVSMIRVELHNRFSSFQLKLLLSLIKCSCEINFASTLLNQKALISASFSDLSDSLEVKFTGSNILFAKGFIPVLAKMNENLVKKVFSVDYLLLKEAEKVEYTYLKSFCAKVVKFNKLNVFKETIEEYKVNQACHFFSNIYNTRPNKSKWNNLFNMDSEVSKLKSFRPDWLNNGFRCGKFNKPPSVESDIDSSSEWDDY